LSDRYKAKIQKNATRSNESSSKLGQNHSDNRHQTSDHKISCDSVIEKYH